MTHTREMPRQIPADVVCVHDYAAHFARMTPPDVRAYIDGAGADGHTHRANLQAWSALRLLPRVLGDLRQASTDCHLPGLVLPHPVALAPVAYHGLVHPRGEAETALGAGATGSLMVVSAQAGLPMEEIAAAAPGPLWFQLYLQPRREDSLALVRRAEAAGYQALVITVDAPVNGLRNDEERAGFQLPHGLGAVNLQGFARPVITPQPARGATFLGLMQAAPRWEDIAWLRGMTQLPLLLKGVLSPMDARLAEDHGLQGVIVSNHGGRALDSVPATRDCLPGVAAAVGGRLAVLCDGGIRRGSDVFKAIALGADAVLVGRPQIHALAVGGASGVAHLCSLLRSELEVSMALSGVASLSAITPDLLWPADLRG